MQKTLEEHIERAKELLKTARHASMATVNEDGSPHNTPFLFMHDDLFKNIYWGSHLDSQHSQNAVRTGQIFVVLYDAVERGGLYIKAKDAHPLEGSELIAALKVHNNLRLARGQDQLPLDYYTGDSPQHMWSASIAQLWVNGALRDGDGHVVQDIRVEISASDLLQ
jgi:hypothetical protein